VVGADHKPQPVGKRRPMRFDSSHTSKIRLAPFRILRI
jgi:hypothetical protein